MGQAFFLLCILLFDAGAHAQAYQPRRSDLVITEIMADPTPAVGLPNAEYIEVKNCSGTSLQLLGWRLRTESGSSGAFGNLVLPADSLLVITSNTNAPQLASSGRTLGISSFPSLDNAGAPLYLTAANGSTIHSVSYSTSWYDNSIKSEGGWSLEMVDAANPCTGRNNWRASTDASGGTPGRKNSVEAINVDASSPRLLYSYSLDSVTIAAVFDEPVDSAVAAVASYTLIPGISISGVLPQPPQFGVVHLQLSQPMVRKKIYTLQVKGVGDCVGNILSIAETKAGWFEEASPGDLVVNEILFNPRPAGFDFVELYNRGKGVIDASGIYIANRTATGSAGTQRKLSLLPYPIFPGDYMVATTDAASLAKEYVVVQAAKVMELSAMPSYPDDEGTVVVLNSQGKLIDEVHYDERWHFALISNREGISLERMDPSGPSSSSGNWHSAAATSGWATPSRRNSQYLGRDTATATIQVQPSAFSPDNDGLDDVASISYQLASTGYVANVYIFNAQGVLVRRLVKNDLLGLRGSWNWDGLNEQQQRLPSGMYVVFTEIFNLQGKRKTFRHAVVKSR